MSEFYPGLKINVLLREFKFFSQSSLDEYCLDGELLENWNHFRELLDDGLPLEYINNQAHFYESTFFVDERVLIPRFETEVLFENILEEINSCKAISYNICEVGTGPGTLSLSVLKAINNKKIVCDAIDICPKALEVAKINAFRHNTSISRKHELNLLEGDRLSSTTKSYDLIFSNPPYIKEDKDLPLVHEMVSKHEPHIALFLPDSEYLDWFNLFFNQVKNRLVSGGLFLMEGHEAHLDNLSKLCENIFQNPVKIINDLGGNPRVLRVRKQNG